MKIQDITENTLSFEKTMFRDNLGVLQGTTQKIGQRLEARDRLGRLVGYFDVQLNTTRDYNGRLVGTGNQLTSLFMMFTKKDT